MGMTNKEKFKEVFGLNIDDTSDCGFFDCTAKMSCEDCPVKDTKDWWNAEYKEPTTKNDKVDCKHTDCKNCVNHKYCDYELNKSEIPTSSEKLSSELEKNSQKLEKGTDYTWEDVSSVIDAMEYKTNSLIENIKSEILHFANAHCSGDDINIYDVIKVIDDCCEAENSTPKNNLAVREFEEIIVEYPPEDLCTYFEYKGKPYFGIKYKENGEEIVGYGTYKPEVLSRYLKDYFMPTTKNDLAVSNGLENGSPIIDWNNCHTSEQLDSIATTKKELGVEKIVDILGSYTDLDWKDSEDKE